MALQFDPKSLTKRMTSAEASAAQIDVGLRQYMLRVYNLMASALVLTGIVAYGVANTPALLSLFYAADGSGVVRPTMLAWIAMFAPLVFVFALSARIHAMKASTAQALFWVFAGLFGLSLTHIFLAFTGASVARVFFITAGAFAALSLYGYTTKRDLAPFGAFLVMGVFGILIASIVNIFLASSALHFTISVLGVMIFSGLTAYDTQRIRAIYLESDSGEVQEKKAIMGALTLYLDFVNLFIFLLQLLGNRE